MATNKIFFFTLFLLQRHVRLLDSYNVPCAFNTMCLCWIQDDKDSTRMDISCLGVAFARFPDVAVSYVAQLDIVNSGMQVLEDDALVSSSGVEALGLMSNRLIAIGDKSLIGVSNSLRSLDLSYNSLEEVPFKALQGLRKLNWLNMHRNHLTSLDGDWGHVAETLANGFFGENSITRIPAVLATFDNLVWLNIDDNNIDRVDDNSLASGLRTLSLNGNLLTEFPQAIGKLWALKWLYLRGNFIRRLELPLLTSLKSLELIDVSDNLIESIGFFTASSSANVSNTQQLQIKDLNISSNKLSSIPSGAFEFLETRRLHLSSNNISYIDDAAFRGLENILEHLNLDNNYLHTVPHALAWLKKLTSLYLANNDIYNISGNAFESFAKHLRALSLATNNLASVPVAALTSCQKLLHLNLGYNKITHIFPGDFQWAENLEILVLRNNLLVKLKSETFLGAGKLKELSLSFNQLVELDDRAFVGIEQSLEILELSFAFANDEALPKNALASLTNLLWLVLDNNNLHAIDADALVTFTKLRYINLESNRINYLPRAIVSGEIHQELRDIMFGYNYFESIPNATFVNLTELKLLDLAGNRIEYLVAGAIENCPKLVTISLAYNRIFSMNRASFRNLPSLRFLHLEFNALTSLDLNVIVDSGGPEFSLNVSFNSISVISSSKLGGLMNLTNLDLGCNNLTQLPSDIFVGMPNLRSLNLGGNYITILHPGTFALQYLEILNLRDNRLETLRKQVFHGSRLLQQLDLSGNLLSQLSAEQFRNLWNLRVVNLAQNRIRSISRDVFEGTRIEWLNLSSNKISIVPSSAFVEIGFTLRDLNLADNLLEHLDTSSFLISHLTTLSLASNRLTTLLSPHHDGNPFTSLTKLLSLDLSHNELQVNFTELLLSLPSVRHLYLLNCSLREVPNLTPLANLNILDLSFNHIESFIHQANIQRLASLKVLKLINNSLTSVPDVRLALLRHLDLSGNPIQRLEKNTFAGVPRLEKLVLRKLRHVKYVDNDCLKLLAYLKHVQIQTWSPGLNLHKLLHELPLQTVEIEFTERTLNRQIHHAFTRRLRELIITGTELQVIAPEAFSTIDSSSELILRIKSTSVQRFQSDIFLSLARKMSQLTLDLRNNHINEFSPSVIYGNLSWETVGTNLVAGGLQVSGNALECDCEIAWLSLWLRRWLREARQIHTASQSDARQLRTMAGHAVCTPETSTLTADSSNRVLLDLAIPHTACQASALSNSHCARRPKLFLTSLLIIFTLASSIS